MNWKRAIGYGVLLWIIMFVIVSALVGFGVYQRGWVEVIVAVVAGVISFILAGYIKPSSIGIGFGYGLIFALEGLILDLLITMRFDPTILSNWKMWFGYVLVLIAPALRVKKM